MKSKKVKLSDILKRGKTKQKEESDDVTLFLTTNAQHYTSSFNILDKRILKDATKIVQKIFFKFIKKKKKSFLYFKFSKSKTKL